jgi:L-gulonolactone oxidase
MNGADLRQHPAYRALTPDERAAVDLRLRAGGIDAVAVAALAGAAGSLEPDDLRFWLSSASARPWALVLSGPETPAARIADELFRRLLTTIGRDGDRLAATQGLRTLSRALAAADDDLARAGFVRDEQAGAIGALVDRVATDAPGLTPETLALVLRDAGLGALAEALEAYRDENAGATGFLDRVGARMATGLFDLVHGALFVARGAPDHEGHFDGRTWRNWTANYAAEPAAFRRPRSDDEIREVVAGARKLRVVGAGHSFNDSPLCDDTMVSLDGYDAILAVDRVARTARVQAGIRLRDLNRALWAHGLGLPVLGSTDAQSIGGLVATDLHGTGRDHGFLSERVRALRIVAADGTARTVVPGDPLFHAAIGGLGTCGVVTEVELDLVDAFHLEKTVAMVDRAETEERVDTLLEAHEHLSFYYVGGASVGESIRMHTWNRTTAPPTPHWQARKAWAELTDFAISAWVPQGAEALADLDEDSALSNRLAPDQRLVLPGSVGFGRKLFYAHDEIEYGVPFERWRPCIEQVVRLLRARDFFSIVELRFTPDRSRALLGPGVGRRTAYIELATPLGQRSDSIYAEFEAILRAHGGQPHLGKKTGIDAQGMLETYGQRFLDFQAVRRAQDPDGKFLNAFTQRVFVGR